MAVYFISDLHLSSARPDITAGLFAFLQNHVKDADCLYLLGDIFDAWIGDDDDNTDVAALKAGFRDITEQGVPVKFQHGNRDFLIGRQFAADTGIELLPEAAVIDLYGRKTLLMHGDSLCTEDLDYMEFRKMVRNRQWQSQVLALPLEQRRQLAAKLRADSQSMQATKASEIVDVTPEEVSKVMRAAGVDLMIHGHTHRPARHSLTLADAPAERIVLGDWHHNGWYLKASPDGSLDLVEFPLAC